MFNDTNQDNGDGDDYNNKNFLTSEVYKHL